jgi:hypothetical protein
MPPAKQTAHSRAAHAQGRDDLSGGLSSTSLDSGASGHLPSYGATLPTLSPLPGLPAAQRLFQVAAFNRATAQRSDGARFVMAVLRRRTGEEHPLGVDDMLTWSPVRAAHCFY